jgi:DNA-binding NarL/FixJ family response regulator
VKTALPSPATKSSHKRTASVRFRVFLMDDHPLVREWLASMIALEPDLEICGQADEAAGALAMMAAARPDIVMVDLTLPRGSGLELIKDLRVRFPKVRLLVLTTHDDAAVAVRAFRAGAHGYAIKRDPGPRIIEAIRAVLAGKFYASPSLAAQLAGRLFGGTAPAGRSAGELLSDRELEVFQLRGQGCSAKEIADLIHVSVKTVGSYEARIKDKLGLKNAGALMREAVLWGDRQRGL